MFYSLVLYSYHTDGHADGDGSDAFTVIPQLFNTREDAMKVVHEYIDDAHIDDDHRMGDLPKLVSDMGNIIRDHNSDVMFEINQMKVPS